MTGVVFEEEMELEEDADGKTGADGEEAVAERKVVVLAESLQKIKRYHRPLRTKLAESIRVVVRAFVDSSFAILESATSLCTEAKGCSSSDFDTLLYCSILSHSFLIACEQR